MPRKSTNVFSKLSRNARLSLKLSLAVSKELKEKNIEPIHIFVGILLNPQSLAFRTLASLDIDINELIFMLIGKANMKIEVDNRKEVEMKFSDSSKAILSQAYSIASRLAHVYVGTEHLLLAVLREEKSALVKKLGKLGVDRKTVENALLNFATYPPGILSKPDMSKMPRMQESILSAFGRDLTSEAAEGLIDPVVGREMEIQKMLNILSRRKKNNPLVVGEAGVGKTALVEALAQRIVDGNVPQSLKNSKIIALDVASIVAGSKMRGDVEEKMLAIINEVSTSPNTILFIDEIHNALNSGIPGMPSDISGVLKPALTKGDFRCIGATTLSEYTKYMEEDNALVRRFQAVQVDETSIKDSINILKKIKPVLERHHNVKINTDALESAVKLSDRYISDRFLPDKAIDLLDEAGASKKLEVELEYDDISELTSELRSLQHDKDKAIKVGEMKKALSIKDEQTKVEKKIEALEKKRKESRKSGKFEVDVETIKQIISKWTGIPVATIGSSERTALLGLERSLERKVVGQEEAVETVASAIKRARTGISDEGRPWASFLFLGPTGVGKTELAKVLTIELFGNENRLIQIDMSEMMEMHSVSKLIGSPPGYVGYREGGQLTEQIRQQPHSVILFDEIEKAHDDVLNILLQILEYGHLTDGKGRRVNFKNTVIILTSNIGAEEIRKDRVLGFVAQKQDKDRSDSEIESAYDSMKDSLVKKLRDTLRPELLNRLDDTVIFRALTRKDALKIVDLLIKDLNERLKDQGVKVDIDNKVKKYIVKEGFSEEYGARPLRRMLQDSVENALAEYLLESDLELSPKRKLDMLSVVLDKDNNIVIKK